MPKQKTFIPRRGDPAQQGFQFLEDLVTAHWCSEVLFAALELDLFARLGREDRSAAGLAGDEGWDRDALERLMEALVEMGLLVKWDGRFANGPLAARHLLPGGPEYLGEFLVYRRYMATHWRRLPQRVRLGSEANRRPEEESDQTYADRVLAYVRSLDAQAGLKAREAFERLSLLLDKPPSRILDLGGGAGAWCRAAVDRWPGTEALLVDLPEVIAAAKRTYPQAEQWRNIATMAGDCRSLAIPRRSFDLIVVSNLLHAYGEAEAQEILKRAAGFLASDGAVVVHDYCKEGWGGNPLKGWLFDLHMLINTFNGRIHAMDRLASMLATAGLGNWQMLNLASDSSIVIARPGEAGPRHVSEEDLLILQARKEGFERATLIQTREVSLEPWVESKCRTGCPEYGQRLQCPPRSPDDQEMARMLGAYRRGLLVQGTPPGGQFHDRLLALERHCFLEGHYKALAFGAGPCPVCQDCDVTKPCRFPGKARPALEACGVDVFETVRRAGWNLEPAQAKGDYVKFIGLVLLD